VLKLDGCLNLQGRMWNIEFAAGMLQMGTIYPAGITSFM
jgi:hypothetical protein